MTPRININYFSVYHLRIGSLMKK